MRQRGRWSGLLIGSAVAALSVEPVWAAATPVTNVRLNQTKNGIEVILETAAGIRPPVFMIPSGNGNDTTANLLNSQLNLPGGGMFRKDNPMPGITSVVVRQVDAKSVQVVVSGAASAPKGEILSGAGQQIALSFSPSAEKRAVQGGTPPAVARPPAGLPTLTAQTPPPSNQPATAPTAPPPGTQTPVTPPTNPNPPTPATQTPSPQPTPLAKPDVLVPNPEITVDGNPAPPAGAAQPVAPAPPFLPRAIAPPVGDIAVSNTDSSPTVIDLGTATRVPRLVLRDAPVREVLALLARSAGLNLAFTGAATGQPGQPVVSQTGSTGPTISLDIENEPVQDVFNYVLQISGLQANRQGRTIFVGTQLPIAARDIITRSFRLNQASAGTAATFLSAQGADLQRVVEQVQIQTIGEGAAARTVEIRNTVIQPFTAQVSPGGGPLLLRGLSVLTDERLNAVTLIGAPRQIEIASSFLTQLDARKRQVAVNVKIVDVNLLRTDDFSTSFSFGVGNSFFVNDGGAAALNFGGFNPPGRGIVNSNVVSPPVVANPFGNATVFLDPTRSILVQGITPGITTINGTSFTQGVAQPGFVASPFVTLNNPLSPGFTNITLATAGTSTTTNGVTTITPGTVGSVTTSLPSLFQYPKKFLSLLQAQVQSGNAKILTDPTLIVQEGQSARVNLTQEVFGGFSLRAVTTGNNVTNQVQEPIIKQAGLILDIQLSRIDDNGFVTLAVAPTVSSPSSSQNTAQGQITLVQTRQLQSGQIRLRDGQTLILAGIIQESDRSTISKIPILGDIPILGALFRSTSRSNQRQEVIVLLTPQIIDDSSRSTFGYNYSPGPDTRQILQRQGFPVEGGRGRE